MFPPFILSSAPVPCGGGVNWEALKCCITFDRHLDYWSAHLRAIGTCGADTQSEHFAQCMWSLLAALKYPLRLCTTMGM